MAPLPEVSYKCTIVLIALGTSMKRMVMVIGKVLHVCFACFCLQEHFGR